VQESFGCTGFCHRPACLIRWESGAKRGWGWLTSQFVRGFARAGGTKGNGRVRGCAAAAGARTAVRIGMQVAAVTIDFGGIIRTSGFGRSSRGWILSALHEVIKAARASRTSAASAGLMVAALVGPVDGVGGRRQLDRCAAIIWSICCMRWVSMKLSQAGRTSGPPIWQF